MAYSRANHLEISFQEQGAPLLHRLPAFHSLCTVGPTNGTRLPSNCDWMRLETSVISSCPSSHATLTSRVQKLVANNVTSVQSANHWHNSGRR